MGVANHPAIRLGFSMKYTNQRAKSLGECWVHPAYDAPKGRRPWDSMPEFLGEFFAPEKEHGPPLKWSFYEETQFSSHFFGSLMVFKTVFHPQFYGIPACYWNETPKNGSIAAPVFLSQYCTVLQQSHIQA
jgi:hypothetical protein